MGLRVILGAMKAEAKAKADVKAIRAVAVVAKPGSADALALARELVALVRSQGCSLLLDAGVAAGLGGEPAASPQELRKADLCIVIGGDGTLIHGVRLL